MKSEQNRSWNNDAEIWKNCCGVRCSVIPKQKKKNEICGVSQSVQEGQLAASSFDDIGLHLHDAPKGAPEGAE